MCATEAARSREALLAREEANPGLTWLTLTLTLTQAHVRHRGSAVSRGAAGARGGGDAAGRGRRVQALV
jgi:hypothetical protein